MMTGKVDLNAVLEVLRVFYVGSGSGSQGGAGSKEADDWLRDFQKTAEAWQVADTLIRMDSAQQYHQLFAAQTFRAKILEDLGTLDLAARIALRDSLLNLLVLFREGPKVVSKALCVALADLALLMPEWDQPIQQLSQMFSKPEDVSILLTFLAALPDESDRRALDREEVRALRPKLIGGNAADVFHMLLVIQNSDITPHLQYGVLDCMSSWMSSGDITVEMVAGTPVIARAFASLGDDNSFEIACDLLCDIIKRLGARLRKNKTEAGNLMPLFIEIYSSLRPILLNLKLCDDDDKLRGFCRIFASCGEHFLGLIVENLNAWKDIIDGLMQFTTLSELEIVGITFLFWNDLTDAILIPSRAAVRPAFVPYYDALVDIMIKHLHYPIDNSWTGEEMDEFRDFRHKMGDVLKSCVLVLGQEAVLIKPYTILKSFTMSGAPNGTLDPSIPWQNIEAPLFALRTMGKEISDNENKILPEVMSMLPRLPAHPKVRYAAILVIGRYASWTREHPEFLGYQMTFVSKGFEDKESVAAASRALRYICDECGERMIDYLSQLHPFYLNVVNKVENQERRDICSALAHVIKHVPVISPDPAQPDMLKILEMFCLPIAQRLHAIASSGPIPDNPNSKVVVQEAGDLLDQFGTFISSARPKNVPLAAPHPCLVLFQNMWPVLGALLDTRNLSLVTSVCKVLKRCAQTYGEFFRPTMGEVLTKVTATFETTREPSLMWVGAIYIRQLGDERNGDSQPMYAMIETISKHAFQIIQSNSGSVSEIADVIEDYFLLMSAFVDHYPSVFLQSPLLSSFFNCGVACMAVTGVNAWLAVFSKFFRNVLRLSSAKSRQERAERSAEAALTLANSAEDQSRSPSRRNRSIPIPPPPAEYVDPLVSILRVQGPSFIAALLRGLILTFPHQDDIQYAEEEDDFFDSPSSDIVGRLVLLFCESLPAGEGFRIFASVLVEMPDPQFADREVLLSNLSELVGQGSHRGLDRALGNYATKYRRRNFEIVKSGKI